MGETFRDRAKLKTIATIRRVAWELFLSQGYDNTTTREIAQRAGVAVGTVFLHHKDKEHLLRSLLEERFLSAVQQGRQECATVSDTLVERLLVLVEPLVIECSTMPSLAAHLFRAFADESTPQSVEQQLVSAWTQVLTFAQQSGETRADLDIDTFALNLQALFRFHLRRWLHALSVDSLVHPSSLMSTLRKSFSVAREGIRPRVKKQPTSIAPAATASRATTAPVTTVGRKSIGPPRLPPDLTMLAKGYRR
jgi:AcrR family transcriptional regulator